MPIQKYAQIEGPKLSRIGKCLEMECSSNMAFKDLCYLNLSMVSK